MFFVFRPQLCGLLMWYKLQVFFSQRRHRLHRKIDRHHGYYEPLLYSYYSTYLMKHVSFGSSDASTDSTGHGIPLFRIIITVSLKSRPYWLYSKTRPTLQLAPKDPVGQYQQLLHQHQHHLRQVRQKICRRECERRAASCPRHTAAPLMSDRTTRRWLNGDY